MIDSNQEFAKIVFLATLVCLLPLTLSMEQEDEDPILVIYGSVATDDGFPAVGTRVELSYIVSSDIVSDNAAPERNLITAETDAQGAFEITFLYSPAMTDLQLAIVSMTVDTFRYEIPKPINITQRLQQSVISEEQRIRFNWMIQTRPTWEAELAEITKYGQDSDKGRLVRFRGLPDQVRRFMRPDGRRGEIWVYHKAGIAVRFIEGQRDKDFYFRPRS